MKTLKLILILTSIFLLFFAGCVVNIIGDSSSAAAATAAVDQPSTIKLIALAALAVYEAVVRIIPSVGDYSAVSWIIKALKKISDTLNITKSG
jgi:hypothetical protein